MSDALKILEAEKAKILADAEARVAEIDRDIARLEEAAGIAKKYDLFFVHGGAQTVFEVKHHTGGVGKSQGSRIIHAAKEIMEVFGGPISFDDLFTGIVSQGVTIGGSNPRSTVSAYLCASPELRSIRKGWWELAPTGATYSSGGSGFTASGVAGGTGSGGGESGGASAGNMGGSGGGTGTTLPSGSNSNAGIRRL